VAPPSGLAPLGGAPPGGLLPRGIAPAGGGPGRADFDGCGAGPCDDAAVVCTDAVPVVAAAPPDEASATPVSPAPSPAAIAPVMTSRRMRPDLETIRLPPFSTATAHAAARR
jgi:hypothetical protein